MPPVLVLHGGVGSRARPPAQRKKVIEVMKQAVTSGCRYMVKGASVLDAVEESIKVMEGSHILNAGIGAAKQADGQQRMDASIMLGKPLKVGAVASLRGVAHPISVARRILAETPHNMLAHDFARACAELWHVPLLPEIPPAPPAIEGNGNTVGAVALGSDGILAAGTSTGGLPQSWAGRIGDTPIIGAGTYANEFAAASATGIGENIMKLSVTRLVAFFVEFDHAAVQVAISKAIAYYAKRYDAILGLIGVDAAGNWGLDFVGEGMPWAVAQVVQGNVMEVQVATTLPNSREHIIERSNL